jgi:hypothetical protein
MVPAKPTLQWRLSSGGPRGLAGGRGEQTARNKSTQSSPSSSSSVEDRRMGRHAQFARLLFRIAEVRYWPVSPEVVGRGTTGRGVQGSG